MGLGQSAIALPHQLRFDFPGRISNGAQIKDSESKAARAAWTYVTRARDRKYAQVAIIICIHFVDFNLDVCLFVCLAPNLTWGSLISVCASGEKVGSQIGVKSQISAILANRNGSS